MSLRDKFNAAKCYLRSTCRKNADRAAIKSLFEREWEVFVIKRDPATGKYRGHTLCCDTAPVGTGYESKFNTSACC